MPSAWVAIGADDVAGVITEGELSEYRSRSITATQPDPVAAAIAAVTSGIRGVLAPQNILDADTTTLPPELFDDGVWLVAERILGRFPDRPLTDLRKDRIRRAVEALDDYRTGKRKVSYTANPEAAPGHQSVGGATVVPTRGPYSPSRLRELG